jgi:hypothetical protein
MKYSKKTGQRGAISPAVASALTCLRLNWTHHVTFHNQLRADGLWLDLRRVSSYRSLYECKCTRYVRHSLAACIPIMFCTGTPTLLLHWLQGIFAATV